MIKQDWEGKQLDKDIILPNNKIYSSATCVFVSSKLNSILNDCRASQGKWPTGVSFKKDRNKFGAQCRVYEVRKFLGYFNTPEEASKAYKKAKSDHIISIANQQTDSRIKAGLLAHAKLIEKGVSYEMD